MQIRKKKVQWEKRPNVEQGAKLNSIDASWEENRKWKSGRMGTEDHCKTFALKNIIFWKILLFI